MVFIFCSVSSFTFSIFSIALSPCSLIIFFLRSAWDSTAFFYCFWIASTLSSSSTRSSSIFLSISFWFLMIDLSVYLSFLSISLWAFSCSSLAFYYSSLALSLASATFLAVSSCTSLTFLSASSWAFWIFYTASFFLSSFSYLSASAISFS